MGHVDGKDSVYPKTEDGKLDVAALVERYEQWFEHGARRLPYLYFPCLGKPDRKKLLISFGAWGGGYNRVRGYYDQLRETHDLLYLQDNHNPEKKGVWYVAENGDFSVEEAYTALIGSIIEKSGTADEDTWFLGSSMGGFAALYFAFRLNTGRVVAMCPVIGIGSVRPVWPKQNAYDYMAGDSGVDVEAHMIEVFDRSVVTESHILFCSEDKGMVLGKMGELINLFLNNQNKFTVQSCNVIRPETITPHNSALGILDIRGILNLFAESLEVQYGAPTG